MLDPNAVYEGIKFWLPMTTAFGLIIRAYFGAKKGVAAWADSLLNNHLHSIQAATETTVTETKKTNEILDRQSKVWDSVTKTLVLLEDRTRHTPKRSPRKR